ncbi:MAG: lysophospholipid acyltransferase family protein [Anaerolineales bacterium]|nr:lysophospholipid acyltransferase family protein [Anaerolineales bacterium]
MALAYGIQKTPLSRRLAHFILRLIGWRTHVIHPHTSRYVLIGAPHTSNWDFGLMLLLMAAEQLPIRFMGKDSLFRGPLGPLMRSLGGIPVNRRERTRLVDQIAAKFEEYDDLIIGIAPEGTRSKTSHWRTGFYYIALKARVPIAMAYLDYGNKIIGVGSNFMPCGDLKADFEIIRKFYTGIVGKNPNKQGEIVLADG